MERTVKIIETMSEKVVEAIDGVGGGGGRMMHLDVVEFKLRYRCVVVKSE